MTSLLFLAFLNLHFFSLNGYLYFILFFKTYIVLECIFLYFIISCEIIFSKMLSISGLRAYLRTTHKHTHTHKINYIAKERTYFLGI